MVEAVMETDPYQGHYIMMHVAFSHDALMRDAWHQYQVCTLLCHARAAALRVRLILRLMEGWIDSSTYSSDYGKQDLQAPD